MAPRKTTIAKEALRQLEGILELCQEGGNWSAASAKFHANSANNYLKAVVAVGWPLPTWAIRNWGWLRLMGWRCDPP